MDKLELIESKREEFRNKYTSLFFNSYLNTLLVLVIFIISLIYSSLKIKWSLQTILAIPIAFLYSEAALYMTHRYQQHRKRLFMVRIFEMHAIWHHGMFSNKKMHVDSLRDMNMVVLPFFIHGFVIGLIYFPIGLLIERFFLSDIGWVLMFSITFHLFWYEVVHTLSHLEEPPILKSLAHHHREHHNPRLMSKYNFGIATTVFDRVLRTRKHIS